MLNFVLSSLSQLQNTLTITAVMVNLVVVIKLSINRSYKHFYETDLVNLVCFPYFKGGAPR